MEYETCKYSNSKVCLLPLLNPFLVSKEILYKLINIQVDLGIFLKLFLKLYFALTAFTPSPSPCFVGFETVLACTSGDLRRRLESALVECDPYFVTTTIVGGRALSEDHAEERQAECQTLHQVEEYFNMTMQGRLDCLI